MNKASKINRMLENDEIDHLIDWIEFNIDHLNAKLKIKSNPEDVNTQIRGSINSYELTLDKIKRLGLGRLK